jgi:hypothetical protein
MPKDWRLHKDEIGFLYIKGGHTLKEVQNLLKTKYGFHASLVFFICLYFLTHSISGLEHIE